MNIDLLSKGLLTDVFNSWDQIEIKNGHNSINTKTKFTYSKEHLFTCELPAELGVLRGVDVAEEADDLLSGRWTLSNPEAGVTPCLADP